ncbi:MAG: hypothetical protein AAF423_09085 [Pseudomonadota bacterium]
MNIKPGEEWNPSNEIQLDVVVDYEAERPLEGKHTSTLTCKNTGTVALQDLVLHMGLDDNLDSFEAVFAETQDDNMSMDIGDMQPGEQKVQEFEVSLVRDDPEPQPAMKRGYRLRIRPTFTVAYSFSQAGHYNVATQAQKQ